MTHRGRVRRTFRCAETDRLACDLIASDIWPELRGCFRAQHGLETRQPVGDFLDADCRWALQFARPPGAPVIPAVPSRVVTRAGARPRR